MPKHKPQEAAPGMILSGMFLSGLLALCGLGIYSVIPVVASLLVGLSMFEPVRQGEYEAKAYDTAYKLEKRMTAIRMGSIEPKKSEEWIKDLSSEEYVVEVVSMWREAGFPKTAAEREWRYNNGSDFSRRVAVSEGETVELVVYKDHSPTPTVGGVSR